MKTKKIIFLGVAIVLMFSFIFPVGCAEEAVTPTTPTELKTYSKYGLSFEYPKRFTVTEMGMLENEATDASGLVQVGVENDEVQIFQTAWVKMIQSTWEISGDLQGVLKDSFAGMEGTEGIASVNRGELIESTKAGHQMLYQYYNMTSTEGDTAYGIASVFYCDKSQKVFQLLTINDTISAEQEVLEDFQNYLDSFVCH